MSLQIERDDYICLLEGDRNLKKLNLMYESGQFEFAVIYGRRRVGKGSVLINFIVKN